MSYHYDPIASAQDKLAQARTIARMLENNLQHDASAPALRTVVDLIETAQAVLSTPDCNAKEVSHES